MKFALVKVYRTYDFIEDVVSFGVFSSEEEAREYIVKEDDREVALRRSRIEYIENYCKRFEPPATVNNDQWKAFLSITPLRGNLLVTPNNFQSMLREHLICNNDQTNFSNYKPPEIPPYGEFFIVKLGDV